jgi:uncharacterized protein (TIGR03905 family)
MHTFRYATHGTCSKEIVLAMEGDVVHSVKFAGGCRGNLQGIAALIKGRRVQELVSLLEGIKCQNGTSCPDQLSKALRQAIAMYHV